MSDQNGGQGAATQGFALVFVFVLGGLALGLGPLSSSRPGVGEPRALQPRAGAEVQTRLWEDPFGPLQRAGAAGIPLVAEAGSLGQLVERTCLLKASRESRSKPASCEVVIMAVTLPGGIYPEEAEGRRRARHAVQAALNAARYAPSDNSGLELVDTAAGRLSAQRALLPKLIPVESYMPAPDNPQWQPPRPGQIERLKFEDRPVVLVMWLDGRVVDRRPLASIHALQAQVPPTAGRTLEWRLIGPQGTEGLNALAKEASIAPRVKGPASAPPEVSSLRIYSSLATLPDELLLAQINRDEAQAGENDAQTLAALLDSRGYYFRRVIADDAKVAAAMINELRLRGLEAGLPGNFALSDCSRRATERTDKSLPSDVAIIGEWDTPYARALARHFNPEARPGRAARAGFCVHTWNYLRGIDGLLPGSAAASAPATGPPRDPARAALDLLRRDGYFVERPEGQSQFDYLRRLAERVKQEDQRLRERRAGGGIRAIGVLGNDVYDKLLVLQALQPVMPNAIFFTTDLDARLLHPREQTWARNLIVASSFGLRLADVWQRGNAPFRDSYQTATYLAVQLALEDTRFDFKKPNDLKHPKNLKQDRLDALIAPPRIFEVSRHGAFDLSAPPNLGPDARGRPLPGRTREDPRNDHEAREACRSAQLITDCPAPHPDMRGELVPQPPPVARWAMSLALLLLLTAPALWLATRRAPTPRRSTMLPRTFAARRRLWLAWAALGLACALAAWGVERSWMTLMDALNEQGSGKPLSLTDGISPWPMHLVRLLAFFLAIYLLWAGLQALAFNRDEIAMELKLLPTYRRVMRDLRCAMSNWPLERRLRAVFGAWPRANGWQGIRDLRPLKADAARLWLHFLVRDHAGARLLRTAAATAVLVSTSAVLLLALGGDSPAPRRGALSALPYRYDVLTWMALQFLVMFVLDATVLSNFFVRGIRRPEHRWPQAVEQHARQRLGIRSEDVLDPWIDLQVLARRTHCVVQLIYGPFFVLALLLLARSTMFDDRTLMPGILALVLVNVALLVLAAWRLRVNAEASRAHAIDELMAAVSRASGEEARRLALVLERARALRQGALQSIWHQPLPKALLLPLAAMGGVSLADYLPLLSLH